MTERPACIRQAQWHERKIDHCHRRYLSTLRSLAAVRRLGVPAVQINMARRQVNVTGFVFLIARTVV